MGHSEGMAWAGWMLYWMFCKDKLRFKQKIIVICKSVFVFKSVCICVYEYVSMYLLVCVYVYVYIFWNKII